MGAFEAHSPEDKLLLARVEDGFRLAEKRYTPQFIGFLDERQAPLGQEALQWRGEENWCVWGGFEEAQRVMLGIFPGAPEREDFPFTAVTFLFRKEDKLTHRDFLGSLMALGIQRETLGDILVEEGRCVLFAQNEIAGYILSQCQKIGRTGVRVAPGAQAPYPVGMGKQEIRAVVASERVDCVVGALTKCSRSQSLELIRAELVTHNYAVGRSASQEVRGGDIISVRGKGKFRVLALEDQTKKGRLVLQAEKYI